MTRHSNGQYYNENIRTFPGRGISSITKSVIPVRNGNQTVVNSGNTQLRNTNSARINASKAVINASSTKVGNSRNSDMEIIFTPNTITRIFNKSINLYIICIDKLISYNITNIYYGKFIEYNIKTLNENTDIAFLKGNMFTKSPINNKNNKNKNKFNYEIIYQLPK